MKKAQGGTLVIVIAVLATALVLGIIASRLLSESKAESVVEICKLSMQQMKFIEEKTGIFHASFNCPAPSNDYSFKIENEYYSKISKDLKDCWEKTLGHSSPIGVKWGFDKDACFICSDFTLDKDLSTFNIAAYLAKQNALSTLDTSWTYPDEPGKQFFMDIKYIGGVKKGKQIETLKKDVKYLTAFIFYNRDWTPFGGPPLELPDGWVSTPRYKEGYIRENVEYELFHHVVIIPDNDLRKLGCEMTYWQAS